jgi:PAS domain S-box-containing protein
MFKRIGKSALGYACAIVAAAATIRFASAFPDLWSGGDANLLYLFLIVFVAFRCGLGPALTALGVIVASVWPDDARPVSWVRTSLLALEGIAMSLIIESLRAARRRAEIETDARRKGEEGYRFLFEGNPRPMWVYDLETLKFLAVNQAAIDAYGYSRDDFLAMTIADLRDASEVPSMRAAVDRAKTTRVHQAGTWKHRRRDGSTLEVEITSCELTFEGRPARLVAAEDVTRRRRIERERDETHRRERLARREAESAAQAKDRFLATLSHELRTPLTPILTAVTEWLDERTLDPELRELLELVRRNVDLETRLIDDLLDLNRIGQGKFEIKRERVEIDRLINRAIEICRYDIDSSGVDVVFVDRTAGMTIEVDAARMQQVIWNLIKNALKFTPERGVVTIRSSVVDQFVDGDNHQEKFWRMEVIDTGVGLDPRALERIFQPFEQETSRRFRGAPGLGLGLAICRSIVEAHGGTICAASEGPGRGSTFTVEIEIARPNLAGDIHTGSHEKESPRRLDAQSRSKRRLLKATKPRRILLVDDDSDTLSVLSRLLKRRGHEVETASTFAGALDLARMREFDVLISDLALADGDGLELMRRLRAAGVAGGIALTGLATDADIASGREAGFSVHLLKPISFTQLESAIERLPIRD